jgi:hypothetical protein
MSEVPTFMSAARTLNSSLHRFVRHLMNPQDSEGSIRRLTHAGDEASRLLMTTSEIDEDPLPLAHPIPQSRSRMLPAR